MVRAVAWRNVRLRYKSSMLGFVWTLLNPLLFLLIFLLIFSEAFPQVENYPVFALSGLILWSFFATSSAHVMGALVENAAVLRSLAVPPLVFPLAQVLAGLFNLGMSFVPFAFILHFFGRVPHGTDVLVILYSSCASPCSSSDCPWHFPPSTCSSGISVCCGMRCCQRCSISHPSLILRIWCRSECGGSWR